MEVLPRPRPHVVRHAAARAERVGYEGRAGLEFVCAVVEEGREITDPADAPWVGPLWHGHRYFVNRWPDPEWAAVVVVADWTVTTVLERKTGERRYLEEPHARRLAARRPARRR